MATTVPAQADRTQITLAAALDPSKQWPMQQAAKLREKEWYGKSTKLLQIQ